MNTTTQKPSINSSDRLKQCPASNGLRAISILVLIVELGRIALFSYFAKAFYIDYVINMNILAGMMGWISANDTRKFGSIFGALVLLISAGYELAQVLAAFMWSQIAHTYSTPLLVAVPLSILALLHFIQVVLLIKRALLQTRYPAVPSASNKLENLLIILIFTTLILGYINRNIFTAPALACSWYGVRKSSSMGLILGALAFIITLLGSCQHLLQVVAAKTIIDQIWLWLALCAVISAQIVAYSTAAIMSIQKVVTKPHPHPKAD